MMMMNSSTAVEEEAHINGKNGHAQNGHPIYDFQGTAEVAGKDDQTAMYTLRFSDGLTQMYPYVWLKDNCRCLKCFNSYGQRTCLMAKLDLAPKPVGAEFSADSRKLLVTWAGGHVAEYPVRWLHKQRFDQGTYDPVLAYKPKMWGKEMAGNIKTFKLTDVMTDDDVLLAWIETMVTNGLAILEGAALETGVVRTIASRIAFLKQSIYGSTFNVLTEYKPSNAEVTSFNLGMHTDLSSSRHAPGVNAQRVDSKRQCGSAVRMSLASTWAAIRIYLQVITPLGFHYFDTTMMMMNSSTAVEEEAHINGKNGHAQNGHPIYDFQGTAEVAGKDDQTAMYTLRFSDGLTQMYPYVWLKDNCRCLKCFNSYGQRTCLMAKLDLAPKPVGAEFSADSRKLLVTWAGGHVAEYPVRWLHKQRFDQGTYDPVLAYKPKMWGKEMAGNIKTFKLTDVMTDDDVLLAWIETMVTNGLAILEGAALETGVVRTIASRIAFLKQSIYGSTFNVLTEYKPSNAEVTSFNLGMHTDLSSSRHAPGVQMLHCIRQFSGEGAVNEFAGGFKAAEMVRKADPEAFRLLSTVNIHFRSNASSQFRAKDQLSFYQLVARPIFDVDEDGNMRQVHYGDLLRAACLDVPVEKVIDVYKAMKLFYDTLTSIHITYKLKEGDVVTFNNTRVLHGRTEFCMDTPGQVRHFEGAYLGWDEVYSRMRVILKNKNIDLCC